MPYALFKPPPIEMHNLWAIQYFKSIFYHTIANETLISIELRKLTGRCDDIFMKSLAISERKTCDSVEKSQLFENYRNWNDTRLFTIIYSLLSLNAFEQIKWL